MATKSHFGRRYRRFRSRNQYDKPLLIFIGDTAVALAKNLPVLCTLAAALLITIWAIKYKPIVSPNKSAQTTGHIVTEAQQSPIRTKYVKIGAYNAWKKNEPHQEPGTMALNSTPEKVTNGSIASVAAILKNETSSAEVPTNSATSVEETGKDDEPELVDGSWILQLDTTSYVMQFASSTDASALEEFIPSINNGEPIAIYPFKQTPSGKTVYGIATGVYVDGESALDALDKLSATVRAHDPWIRKVSVLANQIEMVKTPKNK